MSQDNPEEQTQITVRVSDATKMKLNRIALSLSEPGARVTPSELVRESIADYVEKADADPEQCQPSERGAIGSVCDLDEEKGVA